MSGDLFQIRRGPEAQIASLRQGEPAWVTDVRVLIMGDGSDDPARIMSDKSSGDFDLSSFTITDIVITGGALDGVDIGVTTPGAGKFTSLTVDSGDASNDPIAVWRSEAVTHTGTGIINDTEAYGWLDRVDESDGGLRLSGISEDNTGFKITGYGLSSTLSTTHDATGRSIVEVDAYAYTGSDVVNTPANANVFSVHTQISNVRRTIFTVDREGDVHVDGNSDMSTFDTYEDMELIAASRSLTLPDGDPVKEQFMGFVDKHLPVLQANRIVTVGEQGQLFINQKRMMYLLMDALRQVNDRFEMRVSALEKLA